MVEPIKFGLIGTKGRGESLFNSLVMSEKTGELVEPIAAYDINEENLAPWKFLVENTTTDFDNLLNQDLDAIIVSSPADTHVELCLKIMERGIDVWCEVPMSRDMDGIYKLIDADKSNSTKGKFFYLENYCWMLQPQFCAMHNAKGDFGEIYYCEGEYSHSVEHYLMRENYEFGNAYDPDVDYGKGMGDPIPDKPGMREWLPTWRGKGDWYPIHYPHAFGPLHYVLNAKQRDRPVSVQAIGNKIMPPHRLNGQSFNLALVTMQSGAICKVIRGDILKTERIAYNFWGSGAIFEGASNQLDKHAKDLKDTPELQQRHHWYFVEEEKRRYPERHTQKSKLLLDEDLISDGVKTGPGGHYGADSVMFESIVETTINKRKPELGIFEAAEQMAPLILAVESIKQKKNIDIPIFK